MLGKGVSRGMNEYTLGDLYSGIEVIKHSPSHRRSTLKGVPRKVDV